MINPPVVKVTLIFNALGTIYVQLWKYNNYKPIEKTVDNLKDVLAFIENEREIKSDEDR